MSNHSWQHCISLSYQTCTIKLYSPFSIYCCNATLLIFSMSSPWSVNRADGDLVSGTLSFSLSLNINILHPTEDPQDSYFTKVYLVYSHANGSVRRNNYFFMYIVLCCLKIHKNKNIRIKIALLLKYYHYICLKRFCCKFSNLNIDFTSEWPSW